MDSLGIGKIEILKGEVKASLTSTISNWPAFEKAETTRNSDNFERMADVKVKQITDYVGNMKKMYGDNYII